MKAYEVMKASSAFLITSNNISFQIDASWKKKKKERSGF